MAASESETRSTPPSSQGDATPLPVPVSALETGAAGQSKPLPLGRPLPARPILVPGGDTPGAIQPQGATPEKELTTAAVRNAPPWLISAMFHMVVMVVLALIFIPQLRGRQITLETTWAEQLGDQLIDSSLVGADHETEVDPLMTPQDLPPEADPFAAPPDADVTFDGIDAISKLNAPAIGLALIGRDEGMRKALLGRYGGNATTEAAVELGLAWLAKQQRDDGRWSLIGPYSNGADSMGERSENAVAATAMALLALQGHGNTHKDGNYAKNVVRGWYWLLRQQDEEGNFFHEGPFGQHFYTQGQCTIALCELYGMTRDEEFKEPAERAVKYCLFAQSGEGGWRYHPQRDSDCSVTGWVVMALQSARMAGLEVPDENLQHVGRFLDRVATKGSHYETGARYSYQPGEGTRLAMTAEGLLCRQYLGWPQDDPRLHDGADWITQPENLIDYSRDPNVYYWYYATQVCHHMGDPYWKRWNDVMRQEVPEHQVKKGSEAGSWDPGEPDPGAPGGYHWPDPYTPHGGRLYVTCLSIYMLEVYYRYLPIYASPYTFMQMR